jgi:hypothetical protein
MANRSENTRSTNAALGSRARNLLLELASATRRRALGIDSGPPGREPLSNNVAVAPLRELSGAGLVTHSAAGNVIVTAEGAAWVARYHAAQRTERIDPFIAQHLAIDTRNVEGPDGTQSVAVDDRESPLGWLARRKGRDGVPLIAVHQLAAGERLRAEFTRAHMMPRVTANWQAAVTQGARASRDGFSPNVADTIIAARQRVRVALDAVGPEFSGLLMDVCCFLKGLEDVERERLWPARSAKVVLQLGLDRLARHYGLCEALHGKARSAIKAWSAKDKVVEAG